MKGVLTNLGCVEDWNIDSCVFCKTLWALISLEARLKPFGTYILRSVSSDQYTHRTTIGLSNVYPLLADLSLRLEFKLEKAESFFDNFKESKSTVFIPQTNLARVIRILDFSGIDFDVLKNWLSVCMSLHTTVCCASRDQTNVRFLKFLDCETGRLVDTGPYPYVTLSYMWGVNEHSLLYSEQLGNDLPPTIEDAIADTPQICYRYIWIDRYCIDQQNKEQAMFQIRQMDSIYRDSNVTIVATVDTSPQ
jgi:hypothetical protein